jgi:hypothetical protein
VIIALSNFFMSILLKMAVVIENCNETVNKGNIVAIYARHRDVGITDMHKGYML